MTEAQTMDSEARDAISDVRLEELYPPVDVNRMKLAWMRYTAALQSPAPRDERRYERAVSRVRNAVRDDWQHKSSYVARCHAFRKLILEIGINGFGKWLLPGADPGVMVFHDAVLQAVATVPIRGRDGRFGRIEFFAELNKIAGRH
jgi:hypothetical protein